MRPSRPSSGRWPRVPDFAEATYQLADLELAHGRALEARTCIDNISGSTIRHRTCCCWDCARRAPWVMRAAPRNTPRPCAPISRTPSRRAPWAPIRSPSRLMPMMLAVTTAVRATTASARDCRRRGQRANLSLVQAAELLHVDPAGDPGAGDRALRRTRRGSVCARASAPLCRTVEGIRPGAARVCMRPASHRAAAGSHRHAACETGQLAGAARWS